MRRMHTMARDLRLLFICILAPFVLLACTEKQEVDKPETATLNVAMNLSAFKKSDSAFSARKVLNETGKNFDKVIISVLTENEVQLVSGDILASGGNLALIVPPRITLIVRGEAIKAGIVEFAGEAAVKPIPAGGNSNASFSMYSTSSENGVIKIDFGIGGKPGEGKSGGGIFSKNNFVVYDSNKGAVGEDKTPINQVYLSNTVTRETIPLYVSDTESIKDPFYLDADMSADGQYVVFSSVRQLLPEDTDNSRDIYLRDTRSQQLLLISTEDEGEDSNNYAPSISDNGSVVVFTKEINIEGVTEKYTYVYDRLLGEFTKAIKAAHSAIISGDGSKYLFQLGDTNRLSLMGAEESEPLPLVGSLEEVLPLEDYQLNFDGSKVVFSLSREFDSLPANHAYVIDVGVLQQEVVTVNSDEELLSALSKFHLVFSVDDSGRYITFNYDRNVYVRDTLEGNTLVVAAGEQPFISPDGFSIGFTYKDSIYTKRNPFLVDVEQPNNTPIDSAELAAIVNANSVSLSWLELASADYYRVYASTQGNMAERAFSNTLSWETTSLNMNVLFSDFEFTAEKPSLYYQIAIVNENGVFAVTDEQSSQVHAAPVVTRKSGLYKFDMIITNIENVVGGEGCIPLEGSEIETSMSLLLNLKNNETELSAMTPEQGVIPVRKDETGVIVIGDSENGEASLLWDEVLGAYKLDFIREEQQGSNTCRMTVRADGRFLGDTIALNNDFTGAFAFGEPEDDVKPEKYTVNEVFAITLSQSTGRIEIGIPYETELTNNFDSGTGHFKLALKEYPRIEDHNNDGVDDLIVDSMEIAGFVFRTDDGTERIVFNHTGQENVHLSTTIEKPEPDIRADESAGVIYGTGMVTETRHRKLTVGHTEGGIEYDLISLVNPPVKEYGSDDKNYLKVFAEDDLDTPLCSSPYIIRLTHTPKLTFTTPGLAERNVAYTRCLMSSGTLQENQNYVVRLYSENSTPEDVADDVVVAEYVHTVNRLAVPAPTLDINQLSVNGLAISNEKFNGFIGQNEKIDLMMPAQEGASRYYLRVRPVGNSSWGAADREHRVSNNMGLFSISTTILETSQVRIMARYGEDPMALAVSEGVNLSPGVFGDFNVFLTAGGIPQKFVVELNTDASGNVDCSTLAGEYECLSGSIIDWESHRVSLTISEVESSSPTFLTLEFYAADRAIVSTPGGGIVGSAMAANREYGSVDFQNFSLLAGDGQVDVSWSLLEGADSYEVFWSQDVAQLYDTTEKAGELTTAPSIQISDLSNDQRYYFKLVAYMTDGREIETAIRAINLDSTAPVFSAPTGINLEPGIDFINVSWNSVPSPLAYVIEYAQSINALDTENATSIWVNPDETNQTLAGLISETKYFIRIAAVDSFESFYWSGNYEVDTLAPNDSMIGDLQLSPGYSTINVSWDEAVGAEFDAYDIFYASTLEALNSDNAIVVSQSYRGDTITGLNHAAEYFVKVIATAPDGTTHESVVGSATTLQSAATIELALTDVIDLRLQECITSAAFNFKYVEEIIEINCSGGSNVANVSSIAGLEAFVNLGYLNLSHNAIDAFEQNSLLALTSLPQLYSLDLSYTNTSVIPELDPIILSTGISFPNLIHLSLEGNGIAAVPDVSLFPNLVSLALSDNLLIELPVLSGMPGLQFLDLTTNKITAVPVMLPYTDLISLRLSNNLLTEFPALSGVPNLEELYLDGNKIHTIAEQAGLTNLVDLIIGNNPLQNTSLFENLSKLNYLNVSLPDYHNSLACDVLAAWDLRFDFRDGARVGDIQWGECAKSIANIVHMSEQFNGIYNLTGWEFSQADVEGNSFAADNWTIFDQAYVSSPVISIGESASMILNVSNPVDTVLEFQEITNMFFTSNYLAFLIDGVEQGYWTGAPDTALRTHTFDIPAGEHTLEWRYVYNSSTDNSEDAIIDNVKLYAPIYIGDTFVPFSDDFNSGFDSRWTVRPESATTSWSIGVVEGPDGSDAAKYTAIAGSEHVGLVLAPTVFNQSGYLSFDVKIDSTLGGGYLRLYKNGLPVMTVSGQEDWATRVIPVSAEDEIEWRYEKDGSIDSGPDTFWLDNVSYIIELQLTE